MGRARYKWRNKIEGIGWKAAVKTAVVVLGYNSVMANLTLISPVFSEIYLIT